MIIFLNGPFGVGKTTTAHLLAARLPQAIVYDPEVMGSYLQYLLKTIDPVDDFQDYVLWRTMTVEVARLLRATYQRSLIVPMTVTRRDYYDDMTSCTASASLTPTLRVCACWPRWTCCNDASRGAMMCRHGRGG
jgi:tRNA uridine 5-carbamoylmethylation protein Kti12